MTSPDIIRRTFTIPSKPPCYKPNSLLAVKRLRRCSACWKSLDTVGWDSCSDIVTWKQAILDKHVPKGVVEMTNRLFKNEVKQVDQQQNKKESKVSFTKEMFWVSSFKHFVTCLTTLFLNLIESRFGVRLKSCAMVLFHPGRPGINCWRDPNQLGNSRNSIRIAIFFCTPWKINMEPDNTPLVSRKIIWTKPSFSGSSC